MQFKHPEFFWALCFLIIPIIVHLFQLRRFQKVWFTNVAFLKEIKLQTRKSSTLKKWLTLLIRMLALTALIIAFAEPFFPSNQDIASQGDETVIYIDNSFSMQAKGKKGPLFKRAIQEVISSFESNESFTLFTNDDVFNSITLAEAQNTLIALPYSNNQLSYNEAYLKGLSLFSDKSNVTKNFIFVSDFQVKENDINIKELNTVHTSFVKVVPETPVNISLDSLYITNTTGNTITLNALVSSSKPTDNITVSLRNEDKVVAKTATSHSKDVTSEVTFNLNSENGFKGSIQVTDESLAYDNTLYFSIRKPEKIKVLTISDSESSPYLKRLFTSDEFDYQSVALSKIDYDSINKQNLIILDELKDISSGIINLLKSFQSNGGSLTIIPSAEQNTDALNQLLAGSGISFDYFTESEKNITDIKFEHPLFTEVFEKTVANFQYPKVNSYFKVNGGLPALNFSDGNAFITTANTISVIAAPINTNNSNFQQSPLIVPAFYNMAKNSLRLPVLYYEIGKENTIEINTGIPDDTVLEMSGNDEKFIPLQESYPGKVALTTNDMPSVSGNYKILYKEDDLGSLSYNYNRSESKLSYYRLEDYGITEAETLDSLFDTLKLKNKDNELWKWFVIFALLFLVAEMCILKLLK